MKTNHKLFAILGQLARDGRGAFGLHVAGSPFAETIGSICDGEHDSHHATMFPQVEHIRYVGLNYDRRKILAGWQFRGDNGAVGSIYDARKAGYHLRVSGPLIMGFRRVSADRPRHFDRRTHRQRERVIKVLIAVVDEFCGHDFAWGDTIFNPIHERLKRVEGVRTGPSITVAHAWDHEEAGKRLRVLQTQVLLRHDAFVVVDSISGDHDRLGGAVIDQQLASVPVKAMQVRAHEVDRWRERCIDG